METEAPRYFEIGNSTKGATLFGCVPRRATDNDGILSKILQLQSVDFGTADLKKLEAKTQFGGA